MPTYVAPPLTRDVRGRGPEHWVTPFPPVTNLVAVALLQRVLGGVARVFVEAGDFRPRYQVQQILQSVEGRGVRSSQGGVAEGARGINRPRR